MTAAVLDAVVVDRTGCKATRHGTVAAYNRRDCRCPDAQADNTRYRRELLERNIAAGMVTAKSKAAIAKKAIRAPEPGMVDARPTVDMLRILVALGYDWVFLANRLAFGRYTDVEGVMELGRMKIRRRGKGWVPTEVECRIRSLYRELMSWPAPFGPAADEALAEAVAAGWGVVDLVAVRRVLAGATHADPELRVRVELTDLERLAVVYSGAAWGVNVTIIGRAANASGTTVTALLPTA